jgi:ParB family chromosome partitioning protein
MLIPLSKISGDQGQPRKVFARGPLEELAASIKANGLMQPIVVRPGEKGAFVIVAGERRFRAHELLVASGFRAAAKIEAIVADPPSIIDLRARQIAENVARADLSMLEEARSYADLLTHGIEDEAAAARVGVKVARFRSRLSLLNLSPQVQTLLAAEQLSGPNALELARLPKHNDQIRLVQMINRGELGKWKSVKAAVDAILADLDQVGMFGGDEPASKEDVETVNAMEARIERAAKLLSHGWKSGECVIAAKVSPDRVATMAAKLGAIRLSIRHMETSLHNVKAQAQIALAA